MAVSRSILLLFLPFFLQSAHSAICHTPDLSLATGCASLASPGACNATAAALCNWCSAESLINDDSCTVDQDLQTCECALEKTDSAKSAANSANSASFSESVMQNAAEKTDFSRRGGEKMGAGAEKTGPGAGFYKINRDSDDDNGGNSPRIGAESREFGRILQENEREIGNSQLLKAMTRPKLIRSLENSTNTTSGFGFCAPRNLECSIPRFEIRKDGVLCYSIAVSYRGSECPKVDLAPNSGAKRGFFGVFVALIAFFA